MNFFSRIFRRKAVASLDDPVFGHITYESGVWTFLPNPSSRDFMVTVDAVKSGPSQSQRDFFQEILLNLSDFENLARDYVHDHTQLDVEKWKPSIYSLEIGGDEETRCQRFVLEMCDSDANVIHRVSFFRGKPVEYTFDD